MRGWGPAVAGVPGITSISVRPADAMNSAMRLGQGDLWSTDGIGVAHDYFR